jgi:hypothetical protein
MGIWAIVPWTVAATLAFLGCLGVRGDGTEVRRCRVGGHAHSRCVCVVVSAGVFYDAVAHQQSRPTPPHARSR